MKFDGQNINVNVAAEIMKKDAEYIRQGLITGKLPFGCAFKKNGSSRYDFYISPKLFYEYTGYDINDYKKDSDK